MCPFMGVVVGVMRRVQDPQVPPHHLGPYRAEIQTKTQSFSHQASTKASSHRIQDPRSPE